MSRPHSFSFRHRIDPEKIRAVEFFYPSKNLHAVAFKSLNSVLVSAPILAYPVFLYNFKCMPMRLQLIFNNYWTRLSVVSRFIQTAVKVICRSEVEADNFDLGLDKS